MPAFQLLNTDRWLWDSCTNTFIYQKLPDRTPKAPPTPKPRASSMPPPISRCAAPHLKGGCFASLRYAEEKLMAEVDRARMWKARAERIESFVEDSAVVLQSGGFEDFEEISERELLALHIKVRVFRQPKSVIKHNMGLVIGQELEKLEALHIQAPVVRQPKPVIKQDMGPVISQEVKKLDEAWPALPPSKPRVKLPVKPANRRGMVLRLE